MRLFTATKEGAPRRRVVFETFRLAGAEVRIAMSPPPIGFEEDVEKALPDLPPPVMKGHYLTDRRGRRELINGCAVPMCNPEDGAYKAAQKARWMKRAYLWVAFSMDAARAENLDLLEDPEAPMWGVPEAGLSPMLPELSEKFADHVARVLSVLGFGEGDFIGLTALYARAIGKAPENDDEDADGATGALRDVKEAAGN